MSDEIEPGQDTRRDFLKKAGIYGVPTVLAGSALLANPALVRAAGSATSSESALSSSAQSCSSSGTNGCYEDPLTLLQSDLSTLKTVNPSGLLGRIELVAAIAGLELAIAPAHWATDYTLVVKTGALVFAELAEAVAALQLISNPPAAVAGVISDLVNAASIVANIAVDDESGASSTALTNAQNSLAAGVTAGAAGKYVAATVDYGLAWAAVSIG